MATKIVTFRTLSNKYSRFPLYDSASDSEKEFIKPFAEFNFNSTIVRLVVHLPSLRICTVRSFNSTLVL